MAQAWTRTETVQASQVTGTLTNFTALFSRTHNDFRTVGNGGHVNDAQGDDLCLYSDAGLTSLLKMETEKYVAATGEVIKWAKVPSIATSTVVYWGYGDTGITTSQDDAPNTWDANYTAVFHFGDGSTLSYANSKGGNGTQRGFPGATTGQVRGAIDLTVASSGLQTGITTTFGDMTVELWFYSPSTVGASYDRVVDKNYLHFAFTREAFNLGKWQLFGGGGNTAAVTLAEATWHRVTLKRSGTTLALRGNGGSVTASATVSSSAMGSEEMNVGCNYGGSEKSFIYADIVRISNIARTDAWTDAGYKCESNNAAFWALGTESAVGGAGAMLRHPGMAGRLSELRGGLV